MFSFFHIFSLLATVCQHVNHMRHWWRRSQRLMTCHRKEVNYLQRMNKWVLPWSLTENNFSVQSSIAENGRIKLHHSVLNEADTDWKMTQPFSLSISSTKDLQIQNKNLITFQYITFHAGKQHVSKPFFRRQILFIQNLAKSNHIYLIASCHN